MPPIRYRVPYEIAMKALDAGSGKKVTNIFYYTSGVQAVGAPAYGDPVSGPSDTITLLNSFYSVWLGNIMPLMSHNYTAQEVQVRAILGVRYSTPLIAVAALSLGTPIVVGTSTPHGFATGDFVWISGVTGSSSANGSWVITVLSPSTFSLNGSVGGGTWTGGGSAQLVSGSLEFLYADNTVTSGLSDVGGVAGDALPLYCTASCRRNNVGTGRHFRSRFSLSPLPEATSVDGGFTPTFKGNMGAALTQMVLPLTNGGDDAGSGVSFFYAVSRALALTQPSPFTSNFAWSKQVLSCTLQRNTGSLVRRKPKLTSIIT